MRHDFNPNFVKCKMQRANRRPIKHTYGVRWSNSYNNNSIREIVITRAAAAADLKTKTDYEEWHGIMIESREQLQEKRNDFVTTMPITRKKTQQRIV